ncbi:eukaryotic translation initiation factor 2 [Musa troglodytarum]|uniref:Eukaryotic translation initiation factor 2 n=2 Tax=Musa troglodytarum TaxID=320322 RepID=A0A9E7GVL1_9LILI|nr:eukaryotic translation initiation factor 2 [Musa troglodytarum]URE22162.1 eukaryotic translation initiation factor 2 [Musa troglodytarum]
MGNCIRKNVRNSGNEDEVDFRGGNVHVITSKSDWEQKIAEANKDGKIVVANFSATWCGPCRTFARVYRELSEKYPSLIFLAIDVDDLMLAPFDSTKKKKKKKVVIQDPADEVDKLTEKTESLTVDDVSEPSFVALKKKKKKKKKPVETVFLNDENGGAGEDLNGDQIGGDEEGEGIVLGVVRYPWEGTDRDYKYDELLGRVFNILRKNNPDLAGDRRRTVIRPPQILREGTKKTVSVNFMDLCKTYNANPFLHCVTCLSFADSIDEYVICNGCKSPDTILSKENRLFFLRCAQVNTSTHNLVFVS